MPVNPLRPPLRPREPQLRRKAPVCPCGYPATGPCPLQNSPIPRNGRRPVVQPPIPHTFHNGVDQSPSARQTGRLLRPICAP